MLNFESICRTCSLQGELQSLFVEGLFNPAEMLTEIVDIKVIRGDKYPQHICTNCLNTLKSAYLFKNQCQDVHKKFEQYLQTYSANNSKSSEIFIDCKEELITLIKEEEALPTRSSETNEESWCDFSNVENVPEINVECNISQSHNGEKSFECDKCDIQFKYEKNYKRHLRNHTEDRAYICPICGKRFSRKYGLSQHSRMHSDEKPCQCDYCEKSYKYKSQLQYHMVLKHANEQISNETSNTLEFLEYKCTMCNKQFTSDKAFTQHKKEVHENKKLCNYCGREFMNASSLNRHIRTHTGEKPFACTECDKQCTSKSLLYHHKRVHHSNEKPHKCDFCGKSFVLLKWLKSHLMIHTNDKPFTCLICNQNFRQVYHLRRHTLIHTGEKPFQCNVCNKLFTQNSNLRTHMRTHTGEKPYICSTCGKGFHDSSSMKNHRKKHLLYVNEDNPNVSISSIEK